MEITARKLRETRAVAHHLHGVFGQVLTARGRAAQRMLSVQERAAFTGEALEVESAVCRGTIVHARVPLRGEGG
ncbi:MAG: hypothetical protein ACJ79R_23340 [Anaeromyxobacteraceae bacterium]